MAQTSFQITAGSGTTIDAFQTAGSHLRQAIVIADPSTDANTVPVHASLGAGINILGANGTALDTNSGNKSAGTIRFVLATDQPNLTTALNVALAANQSVNVAQIAGSTTSTVAAGIQLVAIADAAGSGITSNSTTYTSKKAIDGNLLGTLGTAFSTAGKVDVKAADGDVFVRQTTASNLKAQVVSGDATGSAVPANAYYKAGLAKTALPSAASDGNLTGAMMDKFGRQVVLLGTIRDLIGTQTTTISASTSETTIVTAAASIFNDLAMLIVSNTSASTNTRIDFRDTTGGSVLFSLQSNGGQPPVGFSIPGMPIPQTTVNTNWTAQCATSTTDIRVYAVFAKNK